jgi:hypothetical protein
MSDTLDGTDAPLEYFGRPVHRLINLDQGGVFIGVIIGLVLGSNDPVERLPEVQDLALAHHSQVVVVHCVHSVFLQ